MQPDQHAAAWDARDRLLEELTRENCLPVRTLYLRQDDGGTLAIGLLPNHGGTIVINWRGETYTKTILRNPSLLVELYDQQPEGFGGVFGFGEKGAHGWSMLLLDGEEEMAATRMLPNITSFADLLIKDDRFLNGKRKPRAIPLWQLRPEDKYVCQAVVILWERLIRENV